MSTKTLFLRLEGPLQAWGDHLSKYTYRHTYPFPSKSGVIGLICAALGADRDTATEKWLPRLKGLLMGVRIDYPGFPIYDYHTVGAGLGNWTAEGKIKNKDKKPEVFVTHREYLCGASFLVALHQRQVDSDPTLLDEIANALNRPVWTPYLGRKSCPPSRPLLEDSQSGSNPCAGEFASLEEALIRHPWPDYGFELPSELDMFIEWSPDASSPTAPPQAFVLYDVPTSFNPPAHTARFVIHQKVARPESYKPPVLSDPGLYLRKEPRRADYTNTEYRARREERLRKDHYLCVFCKSPATDVHHVTYERAGGEETLEDLRSLCELCHDAITMLEYGEDVTATRIDPCDPRWREAIIQKRRQIIRHRSLETRRRWLRTEIPEEME